MYSFHSLKVINLRTGIDFERLITNHISSCMADRKDKQDVQNDIKKCVLKNKQ